MELAPVALIEAVLTECPGLNKRPDVLGLVLHLLLTETVEPPGRTAPCDYGLLGEVAGAMPHQMKSGNWRANHFLDDARTALSRGGPLTLVEIEPMHEWNLSRRLRLEGVPAPLAEMAARARSAIRIERDEWREIRPEGPRRLNATAAARRTQETLDSLPTYDNTPEISEALLEYLNGLDPRSFSDLRRLAGDDRTVALVEELYPDPEDYQRVAAILRSVQFHQKPIYGASPRTPRVHARGRNATGLPSAVRQGLTERLEWVELDLAHAQLACNARLWGVISVLKALRSKQFAFWDDLMVHLGADPDALGEAGYRALKKALKPAVHGLSFGMGRARIRRFGVEEEKTPPPDLVATVEGACGRSFEEAGARLLRHPVLKAMLNARYRLSKRIEAEGGWTDVLGRRHKLGQGDNPGSLLAIDAQALELLLLEPVVRTAIREQEEMRARGRQPSFQIVLWQHDGFTVKPRQRSRAGAVVRRLQRLVSVRAGELGVPTGLTVDVGPPIPPPSPRWT